MPAPITHSFSKSNSPSPLHNSKNSNFPTVGSYREVEKGYDKVVKFTRQRTAVILPYRNKGFLDDMMRRSKETPGPGAYNVGPPSKIY